MIGDADRYDMLCAPGPGRQQLHVTRDKACGIAREGPCGGTYLCLLESHLVATKTLGIIASTWHPQEHHAKARRPGGRTSTQARCDSSCPYLQTCCGCELEAACTSAPMTSRWVTLCLTRVRYTGITHESTPRPIPSFAGSLTDEQRLCYCSLRTT